MDIKWSRAPDETQWGSGMMVADVEITKDETLTIYAHKDVLHRVGCMFRTKNEKEREELLQSAAAIAHRKGAGTAWERFSNSLAAVGINGVTARIYRVDYSDIPSSSDERYLRRLLFSRCGMAHTYYDDGEAQGHEVDIKIDFMREPVATIEAKLRELNMARLGLDKPATQPAAAEPVAPYYISGPYVDGSYGMCEMATCRILFKTDAAPQPKEPTCE